MMIKRLPKIQIAGIKTVEEARWCCEAGADGIGLLLMLDYPRGDAITPEQAKDIAASVPPHMRTILITHATDAGAIIESVRNTGVNTLQIHNDSEKEMALDDLCRIKNALPDIGLIKVLHIPAQAAEEQKEASIKAGRLLMSYVDGLILDSRAVENIGGREYQTLGGTGRLNDWNLARAVVESLSPLPVIHAGGLTPSNVSEAIKVIRPYGVDVNSGTRKEGSVEKNFQKIKLFVENARAAFAAV